MISGIIKSIKNREGNAVADSSKDLQLRELKDMINDLKKNDKKHFRQL